MAGKSKFNKKEIMDEQEESDEGLEAGEDMEFDGEADAENSESRKRKIDDDDVNNKEVKKTKTAEVKPPTAEELIHLRETQNLFQSNIFRLQIAEMIKEVRPKKSEKSSLKAWLHTLITVLTETDVKYEKDLSNYSWVKSELGITFPIYSSKRFKKQIFKFVKPVKVIKIGSFANSTIVGPDFSIDLAIVMPKKCFEKDDHLDMRYFMKRALYLCVIASIISKSTMLNNDEKVQFWTKTGDPLKPVLVYKAPGKSPCVEIILTAIPEEGSFKHSKFILEKNNVRPDISDHLAPSQLPDTPHYNSQMLEDIVLEENEKLKNSVLLNNQNLRDAIVLIGVWLKQRNLSQGFGSINMHLINMLIVHLVQNQVINSNMSSYQIIRHFWLFASQGDWMQNGPSLNKNQNSDAPKNSKFHATFPVVFTDCTGFLNMTFRLNKLTYIKFKSESELAVKYLNNPQINSFRILFMIKMNFIEQYDHVISFTDPEAINNTVLSKTPDGKKLDYSCHTLPIFCDMVANLFTKGLKERVKSIGISHLICPKWGMTDPSPSFYVNDVLMFGLQLNSETALAIVERGPDASTPEAKEFRSFWGNKCELRRFRDTEVCEAVVWGKNGDTLSERRMIMEKIVTYLLEEKLDIDSLSFTYIADQLNSIIQNKTNPTSTNEESSHAVHLVYEKLSQELRELPGLPLDITSVHCISPVFRFTDVFPPVPGTSWYPKGSFVKSHKGYLLPSSGLSKCPPYVPAIDVVIQMSLTQKWPNDVNAGKRLIAAFYIAIANALKSKFELDTQVTTDCLYVHKGGYMFRLCLGYGKEIGLLKERITAEGVRQYRDTPQSIELEKNFINLPKLTGALYGLSQIHSGFGGAVCLAKRWISAQLLEESHFPEIVVELLVAYIFTSPEPFSIPLQPLPGFLRFLSLLATTNWNIEPIIVNFNNLIDRSKQIDIEQLFNTQRDSLPPLFLATPYDLTGCLWTRDSPTLPTLVRLAKLASACYKTLEIRLTSFKRSKKLKLVFTPPMNAYDVVIELEQTLVSRLTQSITWEVSKKDQPSGKMNKDKSLPITDFNPAQIYLNELKENYGDYALFYYDIYGGTEIGVIFRPEYLKTIEFKTALIPGRKPIETEGKIFLVPDREAILDGFKIIGRDIVKFIRTNNFIKP